MLNGWINVSPTPFHILFMVYKCSETIQQFNVWFGLWFLLLNIKNFQTCCISAKIGKRTHTKKNFASNLSFWIINLFKWKTKTISFIAPINFNCFSTISTIFFVPTYYPLMLSPLWWAPHLLFKSLLLILTDIESDALPMRGSVAELLFEVAWFICRVK